jgi:hypothetical protein
MRDKKKTESTKTAEQEALEKHVDAMMDPKQHAETSATSMPVPEAKIEVVPVSGSPTTAPQLSPKLRKQIAVSDVSAKPLSIDKLDELTKKITKSKKPAKTESSDKPIEVPKALAETGEQPAKQQDITERSTDLDDAQTDEAVDDIVAYEGDVMLAVADSTAEEHNRQFARVDKPKGHPVFSTLIWTLVALVVMLIIGLCVLLIMGDNLAAKLGL